MKKTTVAIIAGFLFLTVAIISCKKDDVNSTPAPTITSFTPTSGPVGVTVTITGTNLNGASAVNFGGTAATSFNVVSSTSITAVVGTGASGAVSVITPGGTASLAGFTINLPDIDGYSSSNAVAADRLLAHWAFDDNATEAISSLAPGIHGTVAFEDAKIGKGISLSDAYLVYPAMPNLQFQDTLKSFTISTWLNIKANNATDFPSTGGQLSSIFQLCGDNFQDIWGLIGLNVTQNYGWGGDTLGLASTTVHVNGTGTHLEGLFGIDPRGNPSEIFQGANHWSFVAITYDGPSNLISFYGNGILLATHTTTNVTAPETLQMLTPNRVTFGSFEFFDDFTTGLYGNPPLAADRPWASHGITAKIDDTRLFTKALEPTELLALTHLGDAGR